MKELKSNFGAALALLLLLAGSASADNLMANGDFSQPIDNGWAVFSTGDNGTASIISAAEPYGDVAQTNKGRVSLYQVIPVDNLNLVFSFSGRFHAEVTEEGYGALAKVAVVFCDADTNTLGKTVFGRASGVAELKNGETEHSIVAKADNKWANYSLNISKELSTNLKKVDHDKVKFLRIGLTVDNGETAGC
jgi:hypothetical protein